ncbi:hypothetical protein FisN_18Lh088 [Fistulifera solaris]|uniref:EF-hand domain-containing protein n=1 Tax=Fistulifera solaris TaxID=1519565 RepID=A0A1Z5KEI4_FISSO|nr:hypothetical protein FisN_18Lh088 [Fistulifera solaris]|eukprot:GAX24535.1 hypothetical protein FisN_18Lh088 [Fistulifera solaris]
MTSSPPIHTAPTDFGFDSNDTNPSTFRFSKAEVEDLRFSFRLLDVSKAGKVARTDLISLLSELSLAGEQPSSNVHRLLNAAQASTAESLTEEDFIDLVFSASSKDERSEIEKVFDMFSNGKEYITLEDLARVADDLGEIMSEEELREMLTRAAPDNNNGKVTLQEFTEVMNRKLFR